MKLLIADDSQIVRHRLIEMLHDFPAIESIYQATDVLETIEMFRRLKPDIMILDLRMPSGTGMDVLKNIRQEIGNTVVIVLTNYPFPQYKKICLDLGARYFFDKSNEYEKLCQVFQELTHRHKYRNN